LIISLILGRFVPEQKAVLDALREELRLHNLVPIMFDLEKPATRDTQETITTLARLVRFIIADITDAKGVIEEFTSIVPHLTSVPVQPLLQFGNKPWGMWDQHKRYSWVLPICYYRDIDNLCVSLKKKVIASAEAKANRLQKR
jgi:hypothetical protein